MTQDQAEILSGYLVSVGSFPIYTIEYPAHSDINGLDNNLKIVTSVYAHHSPTAIEKYVDYFGPDGRTVETRRFTEKCDVKQT